ncbi:MAG: hypothetical protein ACPLRA_05770 [Candidatus Saccharicenans sp.]
MAEDKVAYNLMIADASPALKKLYQSVFPEETFKLFLMDSLEELNQALDGLSPEAIIINSCQLESANSLFQLNAKMTAAGRVPVFLIAGTFEPLPQTYLELLKPEKVFIRPFYSENLLEAVKEAIEKHRVPDTLPEELPENPTPEGFSKAQVNPALLREVRLLIQKEVLESERELEKRLRSNLLHELKTKQRTEETGASEEKKPTDELRKKG